MSLNTDIEKKQDTMLSNKIFSSINESFLDRLTSVSSRMKVSPLSTKKETNTKQREAELFYTTAEKQVKNLRKEEPSKESTLPKNTQQEAVLQQVLQDSINKGQELARQAEKVSRELAEERLKYHESSSNKQTPTNNTVREQQNRSILEQQNRVVHSVAPNTPAVSNIPTQQHSPASEVSSSTPKVQQTLKSTEIIKKIVEQVNPTLSPEAIPSPAMSPISMEHKTERVIEKIESNITGQSQENSAANFSNVEKIGSNSTSVHQTILPNIHQSTPQRIVDTTKDFVLTDSSKQKRYSVKPQRENTVVSTEIPSLQSQPLAMQHQLQQTPQSELMNMLLNSEENSVEAVEKIVNLALEEGEHRLEQAPTYSIDTANVKPEAITQESMPHIPSVNAKPLSMEHKIEKQETPSHTDTTHVESIESHSLFRSAVEQIGQNQLHISSEKNQNLSVEKPETIIERITPEMLAPTSERPVNMTHKQESQENNTITGLVKQLEEAGVVSIHNDVATNRYVDKMAAKAITNGKDIMLGSDYSNLDDIKTQSVLAHEMTHIQQISQAKKNGEVITADKIVDFERAAATTQKQVFHHPVKEATHKVSKTATVPAAQIKATGLSNTSANLVNKLAGSKAQSADERLIVSPSMEHTQAIQTVAPQVAASPSTPVLAASHDISASSSDDLLNSGGEKFSANEEIAEATKTKAEGMDIDLLSEQIFERIKDRLTVERERFHK